MATLLPEDFVAQTTLYTAPFLPEAEKKTGCTPSRHEEDVLCLIQCVTTPIHRTLFTEWKAGLLVIIMYYIIDILYILYMALSSPWGL